MEQRASSLPAGVDLDDEGRWVRAGEVLAFEADPSDLDLARGLGFVVVSQTPLARLGRSIARLRVPRGADLRDALQTIREADPGTAYDYNHIYFQTQMETRAAAAPPQPAGGRAAAGAARTQRIGMVDGAVAVDHPSLRDGRIVQKDFAPGKGKRPNVHGTAVASILAGRDGAGFAGAAPGARLYAASVISEGPEGGLATAEAMVRAFDWLTAENTPVMNVSLAGPPNAILGEAVRRTQNEGALLVAAVGNDGPAAPPLFPAAYLGVVGVTAVGPDGGVYRRAGRGAHVDVAALGVGVRAAEPAGAYAEVTGTSFAAPLVAAWLADRHGRLDPAGAASAAEALLGAARDAGDAGVDPVYGAGVLNFAQGR